ncbi:unnamed protein product [Ambrosiozyma monospora]|uniref:Unnamed protein product n=1 Tax=Ambrosiozyma monospora TaxID=43982 RepID=A0A9W7DFW1_AMBMO|nr:unnamed protein product [Ambrosiozyma monospora]
MGISSTFSEPAYSHKEAIQNNRRLKRVITIAIVFSGLLAFSGGYLLKSWYDLPKDNQEKIEVGAPMTTHEVLVPLQTDTTEEVYY